MNNSLLTLLVFARPAAHLLLQYASSQNVPVALGNTPLQPTQPRLPPPTSPTAVCLSSLFILQTCSDKKSPSMKWLETEFAAVIADDL